MPDATYVEIQKFSIKTSLDGKFKGAASAAADQTAASAIKSAKNLTDTKPKAKDAKGYTVIGTITLEQDAKSGELKASASVAVAVVPGQSIKATLKGNANLKDIKPDKLKEADVKELVELLVGDLMANKAVPYMEKTKPE